MSSDETLGAENPLLDALLEAKTAFRVGRLAEGNTALVEFVDLLQQALAALDDEAVVRAIGPHVKAIVEAQERGDVLFVADLLEYELQPLV